MPIKQPNENTSANSPSPALASAHGSATCHECGGSHEPSGARSDCIRHWKRRAVEAENAVLVQKAYGGDLACELRRWLDEKTITSENIGDIRRSCFMPWASSWNGLVRDETAEREKSPNSDYTTGKPPISAPE
jgi:hypothetical protein